MVWLVAMGMLEISVDKLHEFTLRLAHEVRWVWKGFLGHVSNSKLKKRRQRIELTGNCTLPLKTSVLSDALLHHVAQTQLCEFHCSTQLPERALSGFDICQGLWI